ncbi:MAG: zinc ribbon domain-containing protein [Oscillospiraceae bacterium]|nr:zinc ribbon domain-containing protein [Oscillospiraceae bacterium]
MIFIAGVSPRLKQLGMVKGACPACSETGRMHIVKQCQSLSVFFLPLLSFGCGYIVTCSGCASIMVLRKNTGKKLEKDPGTPVSQYDLEMLKNNHGPRCPHCKGRASDDFNFCPSCGSKLY